MLNLDGEEIDVDVEETTPIKKITPFTFVEAINTTKDTTLFDEHGKEYNAFLVNKALSFHQDTLPFAALMNQNHEMPKDMQFLFLCGVIRKRKRFGWMKKTVDMKKIETIQTYYKYSTAKAMEVADLLTDADIAVINQRMSKGGVNARSNTTKKSTGKLSSGGDSSQKS